MDDICHLLENTNIWDPVQNWDTFLKDARDYRLHVFLGRMYDDGHEKIQRVNTYVKLNGMPDHLGNILQHALRTNDGALFSSLMLHFSDRLINFIEVRRSWKLHEHDIGD